MKTRWQRVLEAAGGIDGVCFTLGISQTTLQRVTRGQARLPTIATAALVEFCDMHDLPVPDTQPRNHDLEPLVNLGHRIAMNEYPSPDTLRPIHALYPDTQLVELAKGSGTPVHILLAVTALLEDA